MAKLNMEKTIQKGHEAIRKNERYDITVDQIFELSKNRKFEMIYDSFAFGFAQGMKVAKKEMKQATA